MCEGCEQRLLVSRTLYELIASRAECEHLLPCIECYPQVAPQSTLTTDLIATRCHAAYLDSARP